jgi:trimethylamine:corrinoid methyltransferase-like protein
MHRFLTKSDMERIHDRSLYLLEEVGVEVHHDGVLKSLEKAGARVGKESGRVRFGRGMVEEYMGISPKEFTLAAKDASHDIVLPHPGGEFYTRCATGPRDYVTPRTNQYREVRLSDIIDWIRLADALENIDFCASPSAEDRPAATRDLYALKTMLENTDKHIWVQPFSEGSLPYIAAMACVVAGGESELKRRPIISMTLGATAPLAYKSMDVEGMKVAGEYGIPLHLYSLPSCGGTAPITVAGIVLLSNVELLAGTVMTQVLNPGTPIIHLGLKFSLDMITGITLQSNVETMLAAATHAEFVKEQYGIPYHTYGSGSDALFPNDQSMAERTFLGLLAAVGGADILGVAGQLECASAISLPQLVLDNDLFGMIRRVRRGIQVDDENLGWEAISEVGPGGQFLDHDHTVRHCREIVYPRTFNRLTKSECESGGLRDVVENATTIVEDLLKSHQTTPLPQETIDELNKILRRAEMDRGV